MTGPSRYFYLIREMKNAYNHRLRLVTYARQAGLEVRKTPLFRYNEPVDDFGNSETFHNLAFQLRAGEVGTPITVPKGLAVIQVTEIVPEHMSRIEEVRARLEEDYRPEQARALLLEKGQEFAAQCKTGDCKKNAQAGGLTVKESREFTQQDYVEGLGSGSQLAAAFRLAPGQTSEVVSLGTNHVVFRVVSHTPAQEADLPAQQDRITEELVEPKRSLAFEIYRQSLKQQLLRSKELKLNDAAMRQLLAAYRQ